MPRVGWAPCFFAPSGDCTAQGHLDSVTRSLNSKWLASLSRNPVALPGSATAAASLQEERVFPSPVPSRGTCLLKRRSILHRKPSASVSVLVSVSVSTWVSARCPSPFCRAWLSCCGCSPGGARPVVQRRLLLTIVLRQSP